MRRWQGLVLSVCAAAVCGCFPREQQRIGALDPTSNIPAMQDAARDKDYKSIPQLVRQLDNDDPAVRFYAIQALQQLTGQTFGYQFYDDAVERRPAVRRWQQWVREGREAHGDAGTR
jgi:hypothetical protein